MRAKSLAMTEFLMDAIESELEEFGFRIGTPRDPERRGGHVSVVHEDAQPMCLALRARGVIPDFRKPDVIRLAPSPLYNSFADCWEAIQSLKEITVSRAYENFESSATLVT